MTDEVRTTITESQLIFLNRQARDILESKVKYNPDQEEYLKSIIESHERSAKEIQRMLLFVNNDVEIRK